MDCTGVLCCLNVYIYTAKNASNVIFLLVLKLRVRLMPTSQRVRWTLGYQRVKLTEGWTKQEKMESEIPCKMVALFLARDCCPIQGVPCPVPYNTLLSYPVCPLQCAPVVTLHLKDGQSHWICQ